MGQFELNCQKKNKKMPLWVSIENVASGLFVALSRAQNGAQLQLEREVREKEEQLWDYEEALTKGIFRNKKTTTTTTTTTTSGTTTTTTTTTTTKTTATATTTTTTATTTT